MGYYVILKALDSNKMITVTEEAEVTQAVAEDKVKNNVLFSSEVEVVVTMDLNLTTEPVELNDYLVKIDSKEVEAVMVTEINLIENTEDGDNSKELCLIESDNTTDGVNLVELEDRLLVDAVIVMEENWEVEGDDSALKVTEVLEVSKENDGFGVENKDNKWVRVTEDQN